MNTAFNSKYLLITNISLSALLSGLGDVIEQRYELHAGELNRWDYMRSRNMTISGFATGFITHFWYRLLDTYLPGNSIRIVVKKVMLDQLICSPISISTFFLAVTLAERRSIRDGCKELQAKGLQLYAADWVIWPPAQFINFYLLPYKFRVLYDSSISLFYDMYTSRVKHL